MGNDNFNKLMSSFTEKYSWQSVTTVDFRKLAEQISGQNLQYFFVQWLESSGAEFTIRRLTNNKNEVTVFGSKEKGTPTIEASDQRQNR